MSSRPLAVFIAVACLTVSSPVSQAATLIYSNDLMGDLEPCGCKADPLGGLVRKQGLILSLGDRSILQLDAGNLLFPGESIAPALQDQAKLQARYLIRGLNMIGQDAAVPGPNDFALGLKTFNELRLQAHFPFLAANLKTKDGKNFLEPFRIFKLKNGKKTLRVAVLGLVSNSLVWPEELQVTPPLAAAQRWLPQLRQKADLLIALTHQGLDADLEMAKRAPGFEIIVGGHSLSFLEEPRKVSWGNGQTFVFQSSYKNQYVGVVSLELPFEAQGHRLVPLNPEFETNPKLTKISVLVQEFKKDLQRISEKEIRAAERSGKREVPATFHTFPKCAGCHMKQFDFWRKTRHEAALQVLVDKNQSANKECLGCHSLGFQNPLGFSRPREIAELEDGAPVGPEALTKFLQVFHSTALLDDEMKIEKTDSSALPLRTQLSKLKRAWSPVQCENCHQPGLEHPFRGAYSKQVPREVCLKCHTHERAPEWYGAQGTPNWEKIAQKRSLITCPAGD